MSAPQEPLMTALLADVATSYVVNAAKLRQQEQLNEPLQVAAEAIVAVGLQV